MVSIVLEYMLKRIYDFSYMKIDPLQFYKCLADDTRLKTLLLVKQEDELCVCELSSALEVSQPKISRHLAQLRECGLLKDRKEGQWVFYTLHPDLPGWAQSVLDETFQSNSHYLKPANAALNAMGDRPIRKNLCC